MLRARHALLCLPLLAAFALAPTLASDKLAVGAGAVATSPRSYDQSPPAADGRIEALKARPARTNQWYSTLLFDATPDPIYAQPLSVRATDTGLEVALPTREVVPTERRDVEVHYRHRQPVTLAPAGAALGRPLLAAFSDWAIDIGWSASALRATVAHGSPYAQLRWDGGDLRVLLPAAGQPSALGRGAAALVLDVGDQTWAFFGPEGVRWEQRSPTEWLARMPAGKAFLAATALPQRDAATLALLARHAYSFVDDTRVSWRYDQAASQVHAEFKASVTTMQGEPAPALQALYPHHWHGNASVAARLGPAYDTVRGPLKLLAASSFTTTAPLHGFVPWWPAVDAGDRAAQLGDVMKTDLRNARRMMLTEGKGPYWQGKGLQRITKLLDVAEVQGEPEQAQRLLSMLRKRMQDWFDGESAKHYFHLDRSLGTVLGYPEEYFAVEQMNDHHFHYGYWIRAAAEVAMRDPEWAARERWGAMVELLIGDIATSRRDDAHFPFLRNFDVYEGHSWAGGTGFGDHGNNQESSSEALNAWAALILWGEVQGDQALRDLGAWLFATETQAVQHYWFDLHGLVFAPEYRAVRVESSMVFGAKYAHNTWWTDEPRQIKGINLLPITSASTHLAIDPAFIKRSLATLEPETGNWLGRGKSYSQIPKDIWQDVFAKYMALSDPEAGLAMWDRWGSVELGDSRTHTLHWLLSLRAMGTPDLSIHADTPLHAVFRRADGTRTYLAYNAGAQPRQVRFSDGTVMTVAPRTLARR